MFRRKGFAFSCFLGLVFSNNIPTGTAQSLRSESHDHLGPLIPSQSLPLEHLFNNVASGLNGDFDGAGSAFPVDALPTGEYVYDRIKFDLPNFGDGQNDNLVTNGEALELAEPQYIREMHILYAGDFIDGETGARFRFEYVDDSVQEVELSVKNWWTLHWLNKGPIQSPYHTTSYGKSVNHNLTQIHHWSTALRTHTPLRSITLPPTGSYNRLHVFALSVVLAASPLGCQLEDNLVLAVDEQTPLHSKPSVGPSMAIRRARTTNKLYEARDRLGNPEPLGGAQLVEVTVANMRPTSASANSHCWGGPLHVWVHGGGLYTVKHGEVNRVMPGDEVKVRVWVRNFDEVRPGSQGKMRVELRDASGASAEDSEHLGQVLLVSGDWPMTAGVPPYEESKESLERHETPLWWDDAKFGIFIHWGIYSVPAWSPKGYYAAWYQWWLHNPPGPQNTLWNYHKEHYGEDFVYDDFIPGFTASDFNASEWIQLFSDAGAKYFVLVTKHHEGFSLFDTGNSTHRSSVHLGPKRDFIGELMQTARAEYPEMRRGTYYSMPEWFNPDAGPYGFGTFPGHLARNAYNESKEEPYTGRIPGKDYLRDIQLAHMKTLAHDYETEIMWCDIGGPNKTLEFAAEWYNSATKAGREVTMNNRCGAIPDFDTPEYAKFSSIQERKWETSEGIDPVCYSYNRETKDEEYRSAEKIIHTLVDITSKNGNYLLNLGPTRTGRIIKPMVDRVLEVGRWLKHSGDCVYKTDYSYLGSDEGDLRFTRTLNTTCIISLSRPKDNLVVVERPLPIRKGDIVKLLGANHTEGGLKWSKHAGRLAIQVPDSDLDAVKNAWAFQILHV
ncbi:glycoside hydrolase [Ceratobasidium sp. AG-I]|nr:glycoside hydrolase [Ceratobasidium sp. AG-I]